MSNKIIEEQRRAREEEIKLKQMKQGLIEVEHKDEAAVIIPKTPKEKLQNYWYHFKWHTIGAVALIAVFAVMCVQCVTREKYDFITVVFTHSVIESGRVEKIEEYLEQYATDIDGDGKVSVQVVDCSVIDENPNSPLTQTSMGKLQSLIAAEPKAVLFLFDDKGYETLSKISGQGILEAEALALPEEFYKACDGEADYEKLPKELKISYRRVGGTMLEKDKTANEVYKVCKKIYDELAKK
jgi:hypothetical protein